MYAFQARTWLADLVVDNDTHEVIVSVEEHIFAVDGDFRAAIFWEEDGVAGLDGDGDSSPVWCASSRADGDDGTFIELGLSRLRQEDSPGTGLPRGGLFDEHAVQQRDDPLDRTGCLQGLASSAREEARARERQRGAESTVDGPQTEKDRTQTQRERERERERAEVMWSALVPLQAVTVRPQNTDWTGLQQTCRSISWTLVRSTRRTIGKRRKPKRYGGLAWFVGERGECVALVECKLKTFSLPRPSLPL
jgi:hypothetical protein